MKYSSAELRGSPDFRPGTVRLTIGAAAKVETRPRETLSRNGSMREETLMPNQRPNRERAKRTDARSSGVVLLGSIAIRVPGETLRWDPSALEIINVPTANALLTKPYREGWEPSWDA